MAGLTDSARQKIHYEAIHTEYEDHYFDPVSMLYRERFIYDYLLSGLDLNDRLVADIACGSGFNSLALMKRYPKVETVGFDISEPACRTYTEITGRPASVVDLTKTVSAHQKFDFAIVIGGFHHCVVNLRQALANVASILKPGGLLLMMEPSSDFFLNGLRSRWYVADRYFDAETEEALSHDRLLENADPYFRCRAVKYFGGPAYFLLLNSLVLRIPLRAKPILWPFLMPLERACELVPFRGAFPCFLAVWSRTAVGVDGTIGRNNEG